MVRHTILINVNSKNGGEIKLKKAESQMYSVNNIAIPKARRLVA